MLVRTAVRPSHGSVLILHPGFLFSGLVERGAFHRVPSGCGHPLGSLVSFVTIDRQRRLPLEGFFFYVVASHFVVLSWFPYVLCQFVVAPRGWWQSFSLACHCSCRYPSSPGFICCFARGLGCATLFCLWLCAHLLLGLRFPMIPGYPSPSIRLWIYWFQWLLFSTKVPLPSRWGHPCGVEVCLSSIETKV